MKHELIGILIAIIVLLFFMFLPGCSILGADLAQTRTYAITKPPFQIVVSGDLSKDDKIAVRQIINDLSKTDFKDYKFNDKIIVTIIGSESDLENVNVTTPPPGGSNENE